MQFTCTQQNLTYGLNIVEKIIGKNFSLPILQNILISCEKNKGYIKLSSTDLEMGIEVNIPAKTEEEGSVAVPAKLINNFIRTLPDEKISFLEKNKKINIHCGNYKAHIKGQDPKEFPIIPQNNAEESFNIKSDSFISGLTPVISSVSLLDIKPEICGVFINFKKENIYFVATDSFRLAEKKIKNTKENKYLNKIIIPRRTCDIIMRIFQETEDVLNIQITNNQITIKNSPHDQLAPKIKLVSKIIEGEYPNYEQIIPNSFTTSIKVLKNDLIRHIKSASIFSNKIYEVALQVNPQKQVLEIISQDTEYGDHYSTLNCEIEGNSEKTVLNFNYLLEGLQNISSDTVLIKINQSTSPILISSVENEGFKYILMPIKV